MNEKPFEERSQTEELRHAIQEMLAEDNPQVKNLAAASKKQLAREERSQLRLAHYLLNGGTQVLGLAVQ